MFDVWVQILFLSFFHFYRFDCKMYMKLECIGPAVVMKAPKKYAFDILYSEGVRYKEKKMKGLIKLIILSVPIVLYTVIDSARTDV